MPEDIFIPSELIDAMEDAHRYSNIDGYGDEGEGYDYQNMVRDFLSSVAFESWLRIQNEDQLFEFLMTRDRPSVWIENPEDIIPIMTERERQALEKGWDEGYATDPTGSWDGNTTHPDAPKNPYRKEHK